MKKLFILLSLLIPAASFSATRMATETFVTNKFAELETELMASNATTRAYAESLGAFYIGSNVVFGVTNYLSGTYPIDEDKFQIKELNTTNNEYEVIYGSHIDITNHLEYFKGEVLDPTIEAIEDILNEKAPIAWGYVTSAGATNEMTNSVWMTQPTTVFAGGSEFRRMTVGTGTVCILVNKAASVYTTGAEGTFYFSDLGGTNKFGFATTESYEIGADPDAIGITNGIVSIPYTIDWSGYPIIYFTTNIVTPITWEALTAADGSAVSGASVPVTWTTSGTTKTAHIDCGSSPQGFFKATIEQSGSSTFFTNLPADFQGGILCTDGIHKVGIDYNNGSPRFVEIQ